MANGYWGKMIEVDMTTGTVKPTDRHMQYVAEYVGGHPLGAKLLWEALKDKPGIDPFGPENVFMLLPGVTGGTPFPGANSRYISYTKSGITQAINSPYGDNGATIGYGTSGGKFGAAIKLAGWDGIYVTGVSNTLKYLYVNNDHVELVDATPYVGKTAIEFEMAMQEKHGYDHKIISIGPAGEKRIGFSAIVSESGRGAGRGGAAAVMGAKKLKGVVVYGDQPTPMANPEKLKDWVDEFNQIQWKHANMGYRRAFGSAASLSNNSDSGIQSVRNHAEGTDPNDDKIGTAACILNYWVRHRSCYGCPMRCMKWGVQKTGPYAGSLAEGPEYESAMNGGNWLIADLGEFSKIMEYIEEQGYCLIGVGGVVGFALECYEKKIITSDMIEGVKLEWGNTVEILKFMDKMLYSTGDIWDWLRRGSSYAARKIGNNAIRYAVDVKNHSFAAHGVQAQPNLGRACGYSSSNRGACHVAGNDATAQNSNVATNSGVMCNRSGNTPYGIAGYTRLLNYITGANWTATELARMGEKVFNIEKVFNLQEGFRAVDDYLPRRCFEDKLTWGPKTGAYLDEQVYRDHMAAYYTERGWDPVTTFPLVGKLQELGLDDLVPYLNKLQP